MVLGWLFGERKKQEPNVDVAALVAQADEATNARETQKGEALCRENPQGGDRQRRRLEHAGVNLIRRGIGDPDLRTEAVIAWMRALALRPGDSRAADHLRAEIQFPDELVPRLVSRLADGSQAGDDAAAVLSQIGERARAPLQAASQASGPAASGCGRCWPTGVARVAKMESGVLVGRQSDRSPVTARASPGPMTCVTCAARGLGEAPKDCDCRLSTGTHTHPRFSLGVRWNPGSPGRSTVAVDPPPISISLCVDGIRGRLVGRRRRATVARRASPDPWTWRRERGEGWARSAERRTVVCRL
jgi:hypothetical protein